MFWSTSRMKIRSFASSNTLRFCLRRTETGLNWYFWVVSDFVCITLRQSRTSVFGQRVWKVPLNLIESRGQTVNPDTEVDSIYNKLWTLFEQLWSIWLWYWLEKWSFHINRGSKTLLEECDIMEKLWTYGKRIFKVESSFTKRTFWDEHDMFPSSLTLNA